MNYWFYQSLVCLYINHGTILGRIWGFGNMGRQGNSDKDGTKTKCCVGFSARDTYSILYPTSSVVHDSTVDWEVSGHPSRKNGSVRRLYPVPLIK